MNFSIKAGQHYSNRFLRMRLHFGNTLRFRFRIPKEAAIMQERRNGYSKLFGVCMPVAHVNSCRIGFMTDQLGTKLAAYVYRNGQSPQENTELRKILCYITPGEQYECVIKIRKSCGKWQYAIFIYDSNCRLPGFITIPCAYRILPFSFLSHPYIGGVFTLNQDVNIEIIKL